MENRGILLMVLLWFFTFGIYPIYWHYKFQSELKSGTDEGFDGLMHLIMLFITLGIYAIYWQYVAGKRLAKLGASDQSILYLILVLVGGAFFNPFLMQSQANHL